MLSVDFLHHSSFLLETDTAFFLFDCFRELPRIEKKGKKLYVLSSHFHQDHFDRKVLSLDADEFFLSKTIKRKLRGEEEGLPITYVVQNEIIEREGFTLSTFDSTDCGVSFVLETEGLRIYFAGDNNAWLWGDEDDGPMLKRYRSSLKKIGQVDVAFVPADPRLGTFWAEGALEAEKALSPRFIVPMHFWEDFSIPPRLSALFLELGLKCTIVSAEGNGERVLSLQEQSDD